MQVSLTFLSRGAILKKDSRPKSSGLRGAQFIEYHLPSSRDAHKVYRALQHKVRGALLMGTHATNHKPHTKSTGVEGYVAVHDGHVRALTRYVASRVSFERNPSYLVSLLPRASRERNRLITEMVHVILVSMRDEGLVVYSDEKGVWLLDSQLRVQHEDAGHQYRRLARQSRRQRELRWHNVQYARRGKQASAGYRLAS